MHKGINIANAVAILAQTRQNQKSAMSPKVREDIAYHSTIGRAMRKKNPVKSPTRGLDVYMDNEVKELKLAFLILTYLYSQDDQKLSKKELRELKNVIKDEAPDFSSDDLIEVYDFFKELPDANYVLKYITDNHISDDSFYAANDLVLENYRSKKVYVNLLRELRKKFKSTIKL